MTDSESQAEEVFDLERIRRLVELMEEHGLSEVDLRQEGQRIRLRRGTNAEASSAPPPALPSHPANPIPLVTEGHRVEDENIVLIRSPMVGTFYTRPNPDAETFVKVGDRVTPQTTVCVIEAMKVFNEIPAEISGEIVAVLADNEEAVEYGKPLFKVDTSR
jgi:acetyl-CoA carboxylase biotin carboxyl carrier protein